MKFLFVLLILSSISLAFWQTQNVNDCDGAYVSLVMDDSGRLFISHGDYSVWLDYSHIFGWGYLEVATEPNNYYTSLAVDNSQNVHIAWSHNSGLNYSNVYGSTQLIGTSCEWNTSIALYENGFPAIAYYGDTDIKFISWDGSQWNGEVVDAECGSSTVSLAINNSDQPLIAYSSIMGFLRLAQWNGSQWDISTIDSGGDFLSDGVSLTLDSSGNPHIACRKNNDLYYYYYDGSQWSSEAIDSGLFSILSSASITVDSYDNPHIAYNAITGSTSTIVYLYNDGSGWIREELEPGSYPSIIIDAYGDPAIAFAHSTGGVKYLCHNTVGIFSDPVAFELLRGVRPNPANSVAWLDITLEMPGDVDLTLCDLSGRVVHHLKFNDVQQGSGALEVDLSDIPSGMYICRITSIEGSAATRLTVLR